MITAVAIALSFAAAEPAPKAAPPPAAAPAAKVPAGVHLVALPGPAGTGEGREVKALLDTPHAKLMSITLRKGTPLPTHTSALPVTIVALQGAGDVVFADGSKQRLDATHMVMLAPDVPHAVNPDAGTDMVLLVTHMKVAGGAKADAHGAKGHGHP